MSKSSKDGKVEMVIGHEDGKVFQRFKKRMEVILYEPQNAIDVARAITDHAFEARDGVKPVGDTLKAELVERHRRTLTTRLGVIMNSQRDNKVVSNAKLAQQLVDVVLHEIF